MQLNIITLPLWGNYGGMLQAYSLSRLCDRLRLSPLFLQTYTRPSFANTFPQFLSVSSIKRIIRKIQINCQPLSFEPSCVAEGLNKIASEFRERRIRFIEDIQPSGCINFARFIVGSDQVWRRKYVKNKLMTYFLDFATEEQRRHSISYAASFGTDEWEGTPEETQRCGELLRQFKAVSVREFSGVRICKEVFGVDAVQMPDPTLLAALEDYEHVINSEKTRVPKAPYFASYVLDDSAEASQLLDEVEKSTGLYHQRLLPKSTARKRCDRFYCTVAQWLRYLRDCDAVVTDSFHGCVFSIIYNKPFVCLGNADRGSARFDTLFQVFGLEDRLVTSRAPKDVLRVLHQPIDWQRVNAIHEAERQRGLDFLRSNLYDGALPDEQG